MKATLLIIVVIISAVFFFIWQNSSIVVTKSDYCNSKIPSDFNGFTIVHISDLHNKKFGNNQTKILDKIKTLSPDIIVVTGDVIDRRKYDLDTAMDFIDGAIKIAPVYYVSGNHEAWSNKYSQIKERLTQAGVLVLDNSLVAIKNGKSSIDILGVKDPDFLTSQHNEGTNIRELTAQLGQWATKQSFKILLSHRPELFDLYCKNNMNLIFSGHAHGGQIRIPFIGGLVAPDQGIFPQYTSGVYAKSDSTMFVSRGLGNSIIPIRIFNRPEIVVVTLKTYS